MPARGCCSHQRCGGGPERIIANCLTVEIDSLFVLCTTADTLSFHENLLGICKSKASDYRSPPAQ
jgi:hypothetical protein